ncbi:uncharacterized protein LOC126713336 [Quercus robur]|uniref:uncharacterized protein LOC126713336 n=1 Tax=Quercus robur TaxID=38942 RepID=UPI00216185D5|nr:uncharacterized protein LOC126713336 [Quercus robur]
MASMQCYKPSNEICQQKCHENSLGQKVPEIASHTEIQAQYKSQSITPDHTMSKTQTQCYSQTQTKQVDQGLAKAQSTQCMSQTHATNGMTCEGNTKKRGEPKKKERRNLLQKIKDGLSGHSSDSSSSSSSESDSDNDNRKCEKRKN